MGVGEIFEKERHSRSLPARTLGNLLNETFDIYGRHFWRIIGLAAVVQVPLAVVARSLGDGAAAYGIGEAIESVGRLFVYGAIAFAVGQQYITGGISIGLCYRRVWRRVMSLSLLALILVIAFILGVLSAILVVPAIVLMVFLVYGSVAPPVVVMEGHKSIAALKRSFVLVRSSWWRVFGITIVVGLVVLGLSLLIQAPFALVANITSSDQTTGVSSVVQIVGGVAVGVLVPPVGAIALTLLYYDLRVRKEGFDFTRLSGEMGIATV